MRRVPHIEGFVPAAGVIAFLLIFGRFGGAAEPAPEARWIGLGLLLAPALMAYAHRWSTAWAALLGAIVWSSLAARPATVAVVWAYAIVALVIAQGDRPRPEEPVPHRQPPAPPGLPRVAIPGEVIGFALLVASALVAAMINASAIAGFGLGCALIIRAQRHQKALRRLFGTPQPVHAARVVEQLGYVHVLLPAPDGQTAREFGFPIAEPDIPPDEDEPHTVAGTLYGSPRKGHWCAVDSEGRLHVPVGPVEEVIVIPYDVVRGLPREIEDDEEQLVDPAALRPADRGADAVTARDHRIAPQRAWAATIAIGLGSALAAGELAALAGTPAEILVVFTALAGAAGYEFGWRSQIRPRLRWHAGGVASVGFRGRDRQPWATDSAVVYDDEGTIVLTAGESVLVVPVPAPWPSPGAQRSADQLVAALRDARAQSFAISPVPPPPEIDVPRRPVTLLLAWAVSVAATTLIVH